jgi:hypothetical protein
MEARQSSQLARIVSQEGCRTLLAMTVESFRIARKAKHKKTQWIPACTGMTTDAGKEKKHFSDRLLGVTLTLKPPPPGTVRGF